MSSLLLRSVSRKTIFNVVQQKQLLNKACLSHFSHNSSQFISNGISNHRHYQPVLFSKQSFSSNSDKKSPDAEADVEEDTVFEKEEGNGNGRSEQEKLIASLQKEVKQLKDTVIRSYAEEENVRRIAKRDIENARQYSNSSFAKTLLDVVDDIDWALASVPKETINNLPEEYKPIKTFYEGVEMTHKSFLKVFQQFKITPYGKVGDKFDPTLHDALFQQPDQTKENGTLVQVLKKGYKLSDRVIRAAQVGTVNNP